MNLAIIADVAPRRLVGLTGGIGSFFANAAGILTPLIIGWTVDATGSYSVGIAYVAAVAILGLLSYLFVIDPFRCSAPGPAWPAPGPGPR